MHRKTEGLALLLATLAVSAAAQTAHFTGVQSIVGSSGQYAPGGVAVDVSGNVYISDEDNGTVYKEAPSAAGPYVQSIVASGLDYPTSLAVDKGGNVYISAYNFDVASNAFVYTVSKESPSGGGYTQSTVAGGLAQVGGIAVDGSGNAYFAEVGSASDSFASCAFMETPAGGSYTQNTVVCGLTYPQGVAVDGSGNVYIVSGCSNVACVLEETPSAGSYTQSTLFTLQYASGLAVDSSGDLYVAVPYQTSYSRVFKEMPSGGTYTQSSIGSGLNYPTAVAVDGNNNVYIADSFNDRVLKESPSGGNFGTVNVGSPSTKMTWIFTFDTAGTIGTPVVLTLGGSGSEFADAGTGTCTTNGTTSEYNIGDTCTVDVVFTPTVAGTSNGSVELVDNFGNLLAAGPATGVGLANSTAADFSIAVPSGAATSVTAIRGGQAFYSFVISPVGGLTIPETLSLNVSGLPAGATGVWVPATVAAGSPATNVTLLVTLPSKSSQSTARALRTPFWAMPVSLGLLLLPFVDRLRKTAKSLNSLVCLLVLGLAASLSAVGMTGCGGGSTPSQQTYTLTITASSGSLSHTTTVNLIVE